MPRVCTGTVVFAGLHHWMPELHRNRVPHRHKPLPEPNYGRDAAHSRLDDESWRHSRICAGLLPFQSLVGATERALQELQWNNGTTLKIPGVFVDNGTTPKGSTWAMNPIPRIDFDSRSSGQPAGYTGCNMVKGEPVGPNCRQFDPPCSWDHGWFAQPPRTKRVPRHLHCPPWIAVFRR